MMTVDSGRVGKAWLAGIAVVGAVMAFAPTASAEPAPSQNCDQQQQAPPEGEQQQCDKGQGMPDLPDLPDDRGQQDGQRKQGRLSDTNCWMYKTGPYWNPPGAMPPPSAPGEQVWPCYYVLGLQPTVAGT